MRILLDTHALLWWAFAEKPLSPRVVRLMANPSTEVFVSAASMWEISIKLRIKKLTLPIEPSEFLERLQNRTQARLLPINADHAVATCDLPGHHRDPFDRMLVAQCLVEGLHLATSDERLRDYPVRLVW